MDIITILLITYVVISILGVMLHFTHSWYKKGFLLHIISAVNESSWEHMKLAFYPVLISVLCHYLIFGRAYVSFWSYGFLVISVSVFLIPLIYYPVRFILGREVVFVSISIYFIAIFGALLLEYYLLINRIYLFPENIGIIGILLLLAGFIIFTYFPPRNFLFKDPIYKKFGEFKQKFDKRKK
jgi:hypothetical protein